MTDNTWTGPPPDFALIVGAARSGTTLTRLLLDSHPEVGCPSEAGLPSLMSHLASVWTLVNADQLTKSAPQDPGTPGAQDHAPARWEGSADAADQETWRTDQRGDVPTLQEGAREWILSTVRTVMEGYCARDGKRIYCDKSLDSVHHLGLVRDLFPGVRSVLVFRHVMDTIASGLEASPWGFNAYGYLPYIQASPGNGVAALASYWLDHVSRALAWEKEHPAICYRIRYEDLVLEPAETVVGMQRFLGVEEDLSVLVRAFRRDSARGPGDYKVEHTESVHTASIGHGKRVPVDMLPPPLLKALNEQLEALGYEPVDRGWNAVERMVDGAARGLWANRLKEIMDSAAIRPDGRRVGPFAVLAEDHRILRWVIDPESGTMDQGDGDVEAVLVGTAEDLVLMLTGEENLGVLLRSGRVRHVIADDEMTASRDVIGELNAVLRVLRGEPARLGDELAR